MGAFTQGRVRVLGLALWLTATACGPTDAAPRGTLRASVDRLAFDAAMVGQRREARVAVLNTLEVPRRVHFRADSAAFEAPEPVELPALGFREVRVRFAPGETGRFAGRLQVEAEDGDALQVELAAEAGPQPACRPRGPCRTSRLDLEQGVCVDGVAADGTACGEGACGGTCAAGTCVTASGELSATWRYTAPEGKALRFPGLVDAEGSVYWYEYAAGVNDARCALVSASREGVLRFRVELGTSNCAYTGGTTLLDAEGVVLAVGGRLEWRARGDGRLLWRPDLMPVLGGAMGVGPSGLRGTELRAVAAGRAGQLYALVSVAALQESAAVLLRLEPRTQRVQALRRFEAGFEPTQLVLDEGDRLFLGTRSETRALDAGGQSLWRTLTAGLPRAAWGGRVWTASGGVLDAQTGQPLYTRPGGGDAEGPSPVGGDTLAFAWTGSEAAQGAAQLVALDVRTGLAQWSAPLGWMSAPLYTARGGVLLPTQGEAAGLVELAADGRTLQDRRLCERQGLGPDWALHAGRVFGTPLTKPVWEIRAYDLPERVDAAARGWAAEAGGPARTGAPR